MDVFSLNIVGDDSEKWLLNDSFLLKKWKTLSIFVNLNNPSNCVGFLNFMSGLVFEEMHLIVVGVYPVTELSLTSWKKVSICLVNEISLQVLPDFTSISVKYGTLELFLNTFGLVEFLEKRPNLTALKIRFNSKTNFNLFQTLVQESDFSSLRRRFELTLESLIDDIFM